MKKIILCFIILSGYMIKSQTAMFDYLNKSENKKVGKYSVPYSLIKSGKKTEVLDSFEVKYYSRLLFHLNETELYSKYQSLDMIRLIVKTAFQKSILLKIIHIKNYDSLLIIAKEFNFSNYLTKDMIGEALNAPINKKTNRIYKYKLTIKKVSEKHWEEIVKQIDKLNQLYSARPKGIPVPDGDEIILEGHFKDGYFFINPNDYNDREDTELKKLIHYILKLL